MIAHEEAGGHGTSGGDVLRHLKIEGEAGEAEAADEAADQQRGHHGGENQEEQVVGGYDGAEGHQEHGEGKQDSAAGDFVSNPTRQKRV